MGITKIEWADRTWNPISGCSPCSPGCDHCYARRMATRLRGRCGYPADDPFRVTFHPERLDEPLHWRKPSRIFVCSMGDLFHPEVDHYTRDKIFAVMALAHKHTFLVLTKRPDRMAEYMGGDRQEAITDFAHAIGREIEATWTTAQLLACYGKSEAEWNQVYHRWPLTNLWLGGTVCNQEEADRNLPILLRIPAAKHFVSIEPMLGPINLPSASFVGAGSVSAMEGLDWVIVGGETGPGARPMNPEWVRSIRDQCKAAGVPLFFKSWGSGHLFRETKGDHYQRRLVFIDDPMEWTRR